MAYWKCQVCDELNLYPEVKTCETCGHIITKDEATAAKKAIAEEEARRKAEEQRKRDDEARIKADAERRKREAEAKRKAEEQRQKREEEARIKAEEERKKQAEEGIQKARRRKKRKWIIVLIFITIFVAAEVLLLADAPIKYSRAMALIENNDYIEAYNLFAELGNYKDSKEQLADIKKSMKAEDYQAIFKNVSVGDSIFFGAYEQDNDNSNGKEVLSWQVLAKNENRILVISKYCLDCKQYNSKREEVTWETCTLREWLNDGFYKAAFSKYQRKVILNSTLNNPDNPKYGTEGGTATKDKVFLLSYEEADKYFYSDKKMKARPTRYAIAQGCFKKKGKSVWCLRSPGYNSTCMMTVNSFGGVFVESRNGVEHRDIAIRPAVWISIDS